MLAPYSPLDFMEAVARERRIDPRILAAQGAIAPVRDTTRRRLGKLVVRFGRWIEGQHSDYRPKPSLATT